MLHGQITMPPVRNEPLAYAGLEVAVIGDSKMVEGKVSARSPSRCERLEAREKNGSIHLVFDHLGRRRADREMNGTADTATPRVGGYRRARRWLP